MQGCYRIVNPVLAVDDCFQRDTSNGDDDFSSRVSFSEIPDRFGQQRDGILEREEKRG
jgi:hypothetical protein